MKPTSTPKLTYDDFVRFPDDGQRHELIDGEHYVTPSPNLAHQRLVGALHVALHHYLTQSARGEVLLSPFDVVLSHYDVVEPDLLVVLNDQGHILTPQHVRGAPAIVIEVLSPGTRRRDQTIKQQLYERVGVKEYWQVDPDAETVTVCDRDAAGRFTGRLRLSHAAGDTLTSALLPDFAIPLGTLFSAKPSRPN